MKFKEITAVVITVASCLLATGCAESAPKKAGEETPGKAAEMPALVKQTQCPVMGGEINKDIYVDVEGKRIYLCCRGCEEAIKKEPLKYLQQMKEAGIALDSAPTAP